MRNEEEEEEEEEEIKRSSKAPAFRIIGNERKTRGFNKHRPAATKFKKKEKDQKISIPARSSTAVFVCQSKIHCKVHRYWPTLVRVDI